jgi:hypothetical protein
MSTTLLGPSARPMVCIGGGGAWKTRTIKGIFCSFQWVDLSADGLDKANACMVLLNPRSMDKTAYVIPQQRAFEYGHKDGSPTQHLLTCAFQAAADLGLSINRSTVRAIIDIVIEGLPDLILMPSEPPDSPEVVIRNAVLGIEAAAKVNGKTMYEEVL